MAEIRINRISNLVKVTKTPTSVRVQNPGTRVVEVTSPGPQGPPFTGASFFDSAVIGTLTSGDVGQVLSWNGTKFSPTDNLEDDLTITGGNF